MDDKSVEPEIFPRCEIFDSGLDEIERRKHMEQVNKRRDELRMKYPDIAKQFAEVREETNGLLPSWKNMFVAIVSVGMWAVTCFVILYTALMNNGIYIGIGILISLLAFMELAKICDDVKKEIFSREIWHGLYRGGNDYVELVALEKMEELSSHEGETTKAVLD